MLPLSSSNFLKNEIMINSDAKNSLNSDVPVLPCDLFFIQPIYELMWDPSYV